MKPGASSAEIRQWITHHLDPLDTSIIGGMEVRGDMAWIRAGL